MKTLSVVIIVVGLLMLLIPGFQFITREKVADVGPVEIYRDKDHNIAWSPIAGAALLIGGIVIFAFTKDKK
jgi:drug/metabolite transporter (DMT)-like permease